ncbi:hypothetical protein G6O69_34315 [Pseudenhygromyxa sp. WMMC2535]|uniref:terpene synthase family protein n=1 Tax=Pseudenhygromyxa sp. WMMC2535 TaxID=2712867 RepID=UPI001557D5F3|nr:hypothetical protein [Pseudenhygromyxa sp. WMMC2535]NVB42947.1 hypothetical protein [Pseudenhygromyxa sp. WMMC2535]
MSAVVLHYPERWRSELSPHAEEMERQTLARAHEAGLVIRGTGLHERLKIIRVGYFGGYSYPRADQVHLQPICDFFAVWLLLDDELEHALLELPPASRRSYCARYMEALAAGYSGDEADVFIRGLANVGRRIKANSATPAWYRFLTSMAEYFEGLLMEIEVRERGVEPTPQRYIGFRTHAAGAFPVLELIECAHDYVLPLTVRDSHEMAAIRLNAAKVICYSNDLASHTKDVAEGTTNMVIALQGQGISEHEALTETARMHDQAVAELDEIADGLVAAHGDDQMIRAHFGHVRALVRGLIEWQLQAKRYQSLESGRSVTISSSVVASG